MIIYCKQVSEGMDDRKRFVILQKVGMDEAEVKTCDPQSDHDGLHFPISFCVMLHVAFCFSTDQKDVGFIWDHQTANYS